MVSLAVVAVTNPPAERVTDNPRSVSRYCSDSDEHRDLSAKLLCLMQTTLCGTLYVYQGEELGQKNVPLSWDPSEYLDVESQNYWSKASSPAQHGSISRRANCTRYR